MSESTKESIRYFQWVKGEVPGKVVEWAGKMEVIEGKPSMVFTDGSYSYEELLNDYILEVASPNEWDLILIPEPAKAATSPPTSLSYGGNPEADVIVAAPPPGWKPTPRKEAPAQERTEPERVSPIFKLLSDSKKSKMKIQIELEVEVPGTDLMKVLSESYEDGEEQVLSYIAQNIEAGDIRHQVSKQIWQQAFKANKKRKTNETA